MHDSGLGTTEAATNVTILITEIKERLGVQFQSKAPIVSASVSPDPLRAGVFGRELGAALED